MAAGSNCTGVVTADNELSPIGIKLPIRDTKNVSGKDVARLSVDNCDVVFGMTGYQDRAVLAR